MKKVKHPLLSLQAQIVLATVESRVTTYLSKVQLPADVSADEVKAIVQGKIALTLVRRPEAADMFMQVEAFMAKAIANAVIDFFRHYKCLASHERTNFNELIDRSEGPDLFGQINFAISMRALLKPAELVYAEMAAEGFSDVKIRKILGCSQSTIRKYKAAVKRAIKETQR